MRNRMRGFLIVSVAKRSGMEIIMEKRQEKEILKVHVEYTNTLGMPVTITKKIPRNQLCEFLAANSGRIVKVI